MTPRLLDIATAVGVSEATVSRALNNKPGVSSTVRDEISAMAEELGYQRSGRRADVGGRVVGVVVPELDNPVFAMMTEQLEKLLVQRGFSPMLGTQTASGVSEDRWIELMLDRDAAGLIIVSGMHADRKAGTARYTGLLERGVPLALVNGFVEDLDANFISDDDQYAMRLAVAHLASLGHRKLGLAVGPERYVPVERKVVGFHAAVAEHPGCTADVVHGLFTIEGGQASANPLLERGSTGLICASDMIALGAIRAARSRGFAVPGEVSVVGYGDAPLMGFIDPPLTTVRQPIVEMCRAVVENLAEEIDGHPIPRGEYLFRPELIVRGSTGPISTSHPPID